MKSIQLVVLLSVILNMSAFSQAKIYVSVNSDDNNSGSLQAPYATIQKAVSQLTAGDTCIINRASINNRIRSVLNNRRD
ncbi:hypothetical protein [Carboxylicivirga marina]|uniref:hypothetical protein n=1 Tax=Carboxylicivirga marina TaxID=2800988 RepID=UPI0025956187|nr:hypothetical protein [uncultured Carboxylicivirga sp.]